MEPYVCEFCVSFDATTEICKLGHIMGRYHRIGCIDFTLNSIQKSIIPSTEMETTETSS